MIDWCTTIRVRILARSQGGIPHRKSVTNATIPRSFDRLRGNKTQLKFSIMAVKINKHVKKALEYLGLTYSGDRDKLDMSDIDEIIKEQEDELSKAERIITEWEEHKVDVKANIELWKDVKAQTECEEIRADNPHAVDIFNINRR